MCFILREVKSIVTSVVVKQVVILNTFVTCVSSDSGEENWVSSLWSLWEPTSKPGKCSRGSYRCANHLILKLRLSEEEALNTCVNYHVCRGGIEHCLVLW